MGQEEIERYGLQNRELTTPEAYEEKQLKIILGYARREEKKPLSHIPSEVTTLVTCFYSSWYKRLKEVSSKNTR